MLEVSSLNNLSLGAPRDARRGYLIIVKFLSKSRRIFAERLRVLVMQ